MLKSNLDRVALENYKRGVTDTYDLRKAKETVDLAQKMAQEAQKCEYPRLAGPIPPEPYEELYCAHSQSINEMSDGNSKRVYSRVYATPFVVQKPKRFEPLRTVCFFLYIFVFLRLHKP